MLRNSPLQFDKYRNKKSVLKKIMYINGYGGVRVDSEMKLHSLKKVLQYFSLKQEENVLSSIVSVTGSLVISLV